MENAYRGLQGGVIQVRIKTRQVCGHHQTFIGQDLVRETANVEIFVRRHGHFRLSPGHKQPGGGLGVIQLIRGNKDLFDVGQLGQGNLATDIRGNRNFPPTQGCQVVGCQSVVQGGPGRGLGRGILPHEDHAHGVVLTGVPTKLGQRHGTHKAVGHLQQQAAAITGLTVGGNATPVGHAGE